MGLGLGLGKNFPAAAMPTGPRREAMSQEERNKLFGLGGGATAAGGKGVAPPGVGSAVNRGAAAGAGGRTLGLGGRGATGAAAKPSAGSKNSNSSMAAAASDKESMGMATWTWTRVKAHMESATNYPRPMVALCRKADMRRWPSEEFPATLQMGQVFRNRDDLAAVLTPPPGMVGLYKSNPVDL
jgi:hypothetical protein